MSCGIYQILNTTTKKSYVGSSGLIKKRWKTHKKNLLTNGHTNKKLQNAWNKYGLDVWEWNILQECEMETLEWHEAFWMARLDSVDNGYNCMRLLLEDDKVVRQHSEEAKQKMRDRIFSDDHRVRLSKSHTGHCHSEETKIKMSKSAKGKPKSEATVVKFKARITSEETKIKQRKPKSDAFKLKMSNRVWTVETKEKLSVAGKGRIFSEETKEKMRKAHKESWARRKQNQLL